MSMKASYAAFLRLPELESERSAVSNSLTATIAKCSDRGNVCGTSSVESDVTDSYAASMSDDKAYKHTISMINATPTCHTNYKEE